LVLMESERLVPRAACEKFRKFPIPVQQGAIA
jgi:hypothetical protein